MAQQQVSQVTAGSAQRIRNLLFRLVGSFLQAQKATVHAYGIVARNFAERLVDGKFHLRVQRIVSAFLALRVFFGFAGHVAARHDFFVHAAQIRRKLRIASVQFARFRLVFLGQLRFCIALLPVFRFQLFERVRLLQANAGKRFHLALQRAHFFELQGILDAFLVFGRLLLFARRPRPRKCGRCKQANNGNKTSRNSHSASIFQNDILIHFSPPTTEMLTGNFTTWGGFLACFTSIASLTALRSSKFKSSFHS